MWKSPIPESRWTGFRREHRGTDAFASLDRFETAALDEIACSLQEHEQATLGRLLSRGKKLEIEVFVRTHGANPLFDAQAELDVPVGVARADVVNLSEPVSPEARRAILDGSVVHVLFQAGEASRFQEGPLYQLSPVRLARRYVSRNGSSAGVEGIAQETVDDLRSLLAEIDTLKTHLPEPVGGLIVEGELGPKQPILLRAAVRRVIQMEIESGTLSPENATAAYREALSRQKILFFVSRRGGLSESHDASLRSRFSFFGFTPQNLVTIEQEAARGITADENGAFRLVDEDWSRDAAGHLYALIQAARTGDFTTYTESGRPIKPMEIDALSYLASLGGRVLSIVRINDMDRHSTEILNPRALTHALSLFSRGYVNAIETVANPDGQKGGTGTTFGDPEIHVLTETHENSFPALSRPFEAALQIYLAENGGRHPAYNAMRQWADLGATREVLREFGGRIVFVPRQKDIDGQPFSYLGVDMPMGDLSLLHGRYPSRMFQFVDANGRELLIHDMKKKDNLPSALRSVLKQMSDPFSIAAFGEIALGVDVPFTATPVDPAYGAPAPEFAP